MKRLLDYLRGVAEEFSKVIFPPRAMVVRHTLMVIVSIVIAVTMIGVVDLGLAQVVKLVFVK